MNFIQWLQNQGIRYRTCGNNVRKGHVAIRCPYCGDKSVHLNISLSSGFSKCWRCGEKKLTKIVALYESCDIADAQFIVNGFTWNKRVLREKAEEAPKDDKILDGNFFIHDLPDLHKNYLESRFFDPYHLQSQFDLMACYTTGYYKYRLIIPIKIDGKTVSFTSRDVTNKQEPKYKLLPDSKALIPRNSIVYNIDSVDKGGNVLIVEGPSDVWRLGKSVVATMTTNFTTGQILRIMKKEPKRVFVLYDSEDLAQKKADDLARHISIFKRDPIEVISLIGCGDPGDLSENDARTLRKEIFL